MSNQFILTPFFLDQPMPGLESLAQPGWIVNKPTLPDGNALRRMSALHQPIADFVSSTITGGNRPVSIAGDCCTAIGVLAGLQHAGCTPVLIWFDAHGDFNTWETTPSGFLGGMPLAMLVGRGEQTLVNAVNLHPIPETQVILVGGRDLDPEEKPALARSGVHYLTDIGSLLKHPLLAHPVYIHLDTDIINPEEAPAMNYLAPGGPSVAELQALFRSLAQTGKIVAVSLSSWNPGLDGDGRSQAVCMALLRTLIEQ
jgi:arginase